MRRSTTCAGRSQRTPRLLDGDLRCDRDAVGRLRHRLSEPSAMPSRVVSSSAAPEIDSRSSRSPAVSVGRMVSVTTPNTGTGVEAGLDLERRRTGHRVTRGDRRLHGCGAPPRGQQREVQVDPAEAGHGEQAVAQQRAVGDDRTAVGRQMRSARRRTRRRWAAAGRSTGMPCRARARRPVTARLAASARTRRRDGSAPRSRRGAASRSAAAGTAVRARGCLRRRCARNQDLSPGSGSTRAPTPRPAARRTSTEWC